LHAGETAHWSITFSVDDADALAARAAELGGQVVVEPFDVPPVRSSVLLDPAGARFTISAFNPG
jgi:predicted enzyme related to lactoylglutathione lyase